MRPGNTAILAAGRRLAVVVESHEVESQVAACFDCGESGTGSPPHHWARVHTLQSGGHRTYVQTKSRITYGAVL